MSEVSRVLEKVNRGDREAADELFRLVYGDLKRLAERYLHGERPDHTLQPTALVHEAYVRLLGGTGANQPIAGRGAFFATAARAMRNILVDSARRRRSEKRGGGRARELLSPDQVVGPELDDELLALHEALDGLAAIEPGIAELVNLRYFGGLTVDEAADALGIARRTAAYHWAYARAWLLEAIDGPQG